MRVEIPLLHTVSSRDGTENYDSHNKNGIPIVQGKMAVLKKRPALVAYQNSNFAVHAMMSDVGRTGAMYACGYDSSSGQTLSAIYAYEQPGTNTGSRTTFTIDNTGNTFSSKDTSIRLVSDVTTTSTVASRGLVARIGNHFYYITLGNGLPSAAGAGSMADQYSSLPTDLQNSGRCAGIGYLDGYTFLGASNGDIYNSDLDDPTSWSDLNCVSKEMNSDPLVYVTDLGQYIVAFGTQSIEFFYDAGNTNGSPLNPRTDLTYRIGLHQNQNDYVASPIWVDPRGQYILFVGINPEGNFGVYLLDTSLKLEKISDEYIDAYLNRGQTAGTGAYLSFAVNGFLAYGKTIFSLKIESTDATYTYYYDMATKSWGFLSTGVTNSGTQLAWPFEFSGALAGHYNNATGAKNTMSTSFVGGSDGVYRLEEFTYQDNDGSSNYTFPVVVQTGRYLGNSPQYQSSRKYQRDMAIIADRGSTTNDVTVSWTDDDYENFSTGRTLDLHNPKSQLSGLGSFYERAWRITHEANSDLRLLAAEAEIDTGYT